MSVVVKWREGAEEDRNEDPMEETQYWNAHGREWKHLLLLLV